GAPHDEAPSGLAINRRADIGPDRFDLLHVERAAPGRHLSLAVEYRAHESIVVFAAQTAEIEGHAAAGVAQAFAVAVRAIVGIDPFAGGDLRRTRGLRERRARADDEGDNGGGDQRLQGPVLHSSSDTRFTIASRGAGPNLRRL